MLYPYALVHLAHRPVSLAVSAGQLAVILVNVMLVSAAIVWWCHWRISRSNMSARLATGFVVVGMHETPLAGLGMQDLELREQSVRFSASVVLVAGILVWLAWSAYRRRPPRRDPLLTGTALATMAVVLRLSLLPTGWNRVLEVGRPLDLAMLAGTIVLTGVACVLVLRSRTLPRGVAAHLVVAAGLYLAGRSWSTIVDAGYPPLVSVAALSLAGSLILVHSTVVLWATLADHGRFMEDLVERASIAETSRRRDREVAHELRATTAGIVAAAAILVDDRMPAGHQRAALRRMLDSEVARVDRLIADSDRDKICDVCVDDVVEPLVVAQAALGHWVAWEPTEHVVIARRDALAEVINILLTNAARHGEGTGTTVHTRAVESEVEIRVSDRGPGISEERRRTLFRPVSPDRVSSGHGIGLGLAHRLMLEQGGALRLEPPMSDADTGATFVATVPAARAATVDPARMPTDPSLLGAAITREAG